jgi:hypothetical protein
MCNTDYYDDDDDDDDDISWCNLEKVFLIRNPYRFSKPTHVKPRQSAVPGILSPAPCLPPSLPLSISPESRPL